LQAAEQVFAREGFRAATVRDIADLAGMLSGSLYYYFESKEAIALAIIRPHLEDVIRRQGNSLHGTDDPVLSLRSLIGENLAITLERPTVIAIMHKDWPYLRNLDCFSEAVDVYNRVATPWLAVIERGKAVGLFMEGHSALIYRSIQSICLETVRWFNPSGPLSYEEVTRLQTELILGGVVARVPLVKAPS
jgi:AcrR family transcriptional regulator